MATQNNTAEMARRVLELGKDNVNRNAKDSIFTDLFGKTEYLIQLYRVLHPEDTETTESVLKRSRSAKTFSEPRQAAWMSPSE